MPKKTIGRPTMLTRAEFSPLAGAEPLILKAYLTDGKTDVIIRANDVRREWITRDTDGNAYRCIPINMASSLGWSFLMPFTLTVVYDGKRMAISARSRRIDATRLVTDQFGGGIFTFYVAVMFRSPPGHNLFVTGPLNEPRRGASPLSGIVETDWVEVNFTMNWKVTELNHPVTFHKGEPFCTFFPYPRHYAENFRPEIRLLSEEPELQVRYERWLFHRLTTESPEGQYARGEHYIDAGRGPFPDHQRRIQMEEFQLRRQRRSSR
ncbi:hypothetical protein HZ992_12315 [Rhizobacter sp. AJA081-3]|uniref:DUF6065 family protein n=1 Tax=Rhizobacter sp. AJA081-3 TaxID=2753607 RepID=UPI001AE010B3|nr:DUF6065 family protein [Rhizobacter sp. AJA081-3]QTN25683.1 hypothetical protein HZ992_12315 [Rhizobacter sp. AJA081-3]